MLDIVGVDPVEGMHGRVGYGLPPGEQVLADRGAVEPIEQGLTDAPVGERRVVEHHVDVLEDQAGLVEDLEAVAVAALEGQGLVQRQADRPLDHVDLAGQQVRLERGRVLDRLDDDPVEHRRSPHQVGLRSRTIWLPGTICAIR